MCGFNNRQVMKGGKRGYIFVECRREGFGMTSTSVYSETWLATRNEGVDSARHRVCAQGDWW